MLRSYFGCLIVILFHLARGAREHVHTHCETSGETRPAYFSLDDFSEATGKYFCHPANSERNGNFELTRANTKIHGEYCGMFNGVVCCKMDGYGWMPTYHHIGGEPDSQKYYAVYKKGFHKADLPMRRFLQTLCPADEPTGAPTGTQTIAPTSSPTFTIGASEIPTTSLSGGPDLFVIVGVGFVIGIVVLGIIKFQEPIKKALTGN